MWKHIEYHVQITFKAYLRVVMSSTIARADCSCQFLVSLIAVHSLFSVFFVCTIYFTENDISTVLSSRADQTKLKCVNRPLSLRIRYQRCEFIIGSFALSRAHQYENYRKNISEYVVFFDNASIRERENTSMSGRLAKLINNKSKRKVTTFFHDFWEISDYPEQEEGSCWELISIYRPTRKMTRSQGLASIGFCHALLHSRRYVKFIAKRDIRCALVKYLRLPCSKHSSKYVIFVYIYKFYAIHLS